MKVGSSAENAKVAQVLTCPLEFSVEVVLTATLSIKVSSNSCIVSKNTGDYCIFDSSAGMNESAGSPGILCALGA